MLRQLSVSNYILIPETELNFSPGFTCITGETGAGKSIIVGALSLLLGDRADVGVLRNPDQKCVVEALFSIATLDLQATFEQLDLDYSHETTIRREISPQGKSRAFVNDTPVNLNILRSVGALLVDIHSQHLTLHLLQPGFQLNLLDAYAGNTSEVKSYQHQFIQYQQDKALLAKLILEGSKAQAEKSFIEFQVQEIAQAAFSPGEQEMLENELSELSHASEIKVRTYAALQHLENEETAALETTRQAVNELQSVSAYSKSAAALAERLLATSIEMKDIAAELSHEYQRLDFDQDRIEQVSARIDTLYSLLKKHRVQGLSELLELQEGFVSRLSKMDSLNMQIEGLQQALAKSHGHLLESATKLSLERHKAIAPIEKEMKGLLATLGMPSARFEIAHDTETEPGQDGIDKIRFLFSANLGSSPREIKEVASGGETSRLMLALKSLVLKKNLLPTIIFDEIDSGVSGEIAGKVGNILRTMAQRIQVIAISHLPQIAAKSDVHLLAYKQEIQGTTISHLRQLDADERVNEVARMLSDEKVTQASRLAAIELLQSNPSN